MTQNQLRYAELKETMRHNTATERNADSVLSETNRHNVAQESYWTESNAVNRSHLERMDSETQRHNMVTEDIQYYNAQTQALNVTEQARHNVATEVINAAIARETQRHNVQSESVSRSQASAALTQAEAASQNATTNSLAQASQHSKNKSEISLNQKRAEDLQSQITKRQFDRVVQTIDTMSEANRDNSTAFKNIINGFTDIIKLVPGI